VLCAIDGFARSTDRAALAMDLSSAQQSIDRAARSEDAHAVIAPTDRAARSVDRAVLRDRQRCAFDLPGISGSLFR